MRSGIVLRLSKEVSGDPVGIVVLVGDDQHFRWPGDHVDADRAEDDAFGRRNIGVAGADDLGNRTNCFGAIGEGCDSLRAADTINLGNASQTCCHQNQWIENAVRCWNHHDNALYTCHLGWNSVHQYGTWVACRAARNIEPHSFDSGPARTELNAKRIRITIIFRQLPRVVFLDALVSKLQRFDRRCRGYVECGIDFSFSDRNSGFFEIDPVKAPGIVDERTVTFTTHPFNDLAGRTIDILGRLAFAGQKCREIILEIGIGLSERLDHASVPSNMLCQTGVWLTKDGFV